MNHTASIINFMIVLIIVAHVSVPIIKKTMHERRVRLIKSKVLLQNKLKTVRKQYEDANIAYIKAFEKKASWIIEAKQVLRKQVDSLKEKHDMKLNALSDEYKHEVEKIKRNNKLNYIADLMKEFKKHIRSQK